MKNQLKLNAIEMLITFVQLFILIRKIAILVLNETLNSKLDLFHDSNKYDVTMTSQTSKNQSLHFKMKSSGSGAKGAA